MENKIVSWPEGDLEYSVGGTGPAVMLIHGFGEDNSIWNEAPSIFKQNRLIIPNLPGTGASSDLSNTASLEKFAGSLKFILDAESISSVIMVGHSMGGYTMLTFVESYPEIVSNMVMFHSSAFADSDEKKEARKKSIDFIRENGKEAFLKTTLPGLFYNAEKSREDINNLLEKGNRFTENALVHYYEAMMNRTERLNVLENFKGKVLFIIGQHDKAVPFDASMKQVSVPEQPEICILRESAHMGMLEEKEKVWGVISAFISEATVK